MIERSKVLNLSQHQVFRPNEKGQSLAELAVVLVILLILLAGIIDLGRMIFLYMSMRDAAQEGASYAAVFPTHCAQINDRVRDFLPPHSNPFQVTVNIGGVSCASADPGQACAGEFNNVKNEVFVEIRTDFDITMPFLSAFTGEVIDLNTSITDTIVRPKCP